ncbi:MAG: SMC family ATPase [Bdellovibrio sp.]|nr:SMC family ATPase [Bdellovibrio sp.]
MRIKRLTLHNIACFKGVHTIEIERMHGDQELFAITGATGAGKSTLLASLCLALYGKTPKRALNSADFVSQGEGEGAIRLSFSHGPDNFEAIWSCRLRKADGTVFKTPMVKRDIFKEGIPVEGGAEEILGLNFEQFTKTVILPQGEFSRFILASATERRDILETLWHGPSMKDFSSLLCSKANVMQSEITLLKAKESQLLEMHQRARATEPYPKETLEASIQAKTIALTALNSFEKEACAVLLHYSKLQQCFQDQQNHQRAADQTQTFYRKYFRELEEISREIAASQCDFESSLRTYGKHKHIIGEEFALQKVISDLHSHNLADWQSKIQGLFKNWENRLTLLKKARAENGEISIAGPLAKYSDVLNGLQQKRDQLQNQLFEYKRKRDYYLNQLDLCLGQIKEIEAVILVTLQSLDMLAKKLIHDDFNDLFKTTIQALTFIPQKEEVFNPQQFFSALDLFIKNELKQQKAQLLSDMTLLKNQISETSLAEQFQLQVKTELAQIQKALSDLENQYGPLSDLLKVLGRGEFRDYILTSIESYLIQLANHELSSFCQGRYRLVALTVSHGHEIFIQDTFFNMSDRLERPRDYTRKVASLSGGETFLVGLALALGLSELFKGNAEIESFFIDEGLGSLDADSLQETLEGLQLLASKGKQVGIISHIPSLNDQLPTHFQITKNAKGTSTIEMLRWDCANIENLFSK